jgi:hypothetical protein
MADLADVEAALVAAIAGAVYPNGTSQPSAVVLAGGRRPGSRVFAGWPVPANLDADLLAGTPPGSASVLNISVFAQPGMERDVTRYPREWQDQIKTAPTITVTVAGSTITLAGAPTIGNWVSIIAFGKDFSRACVANDTLASVAAALAATINAVLPAYAVGPAITIIGRSDIKARTAAPGTAILELERTNQRFLVTIWAPSNDARVAAARVVRPALALIDFLTLADGSQARLLYENSSDIDRSEKNSLVCRDIYYWVEYPTTVTAPGYPITIYQHQINTPDGTPGGATYIADA